MKLNLITFLYQFGLGKTNLRTNNTYFLAFEAACQLTFPKIVTKNMLFLRKDFMV